jgi:protein-disulfide isomerase
MRTTTWAGILAMPVIPGRDHIRGPEDAPVSLVEYGDFQCPFCGAAHSVVEAVRAEMGDDLQFVYRHFPLVTVHPYAAGAAAAAEAAGAQGAFWPMHDSLFEDQEHLAPPYLVARAADLGLDVKRFEAELEGQVHVPRIQEDLLSGVQSGVHGTPTFFVNGVRHDGPADLPSLLAAAELALAG